MAVAKPSVSERKKHECSNAANQVWKIGIIRRFAALAFEKLCLSGDFAAAKDLFQAERANYYDIFA